MIHVIECSECGLPFRVMPVGGGYGNAACGNGHEVNTYKDIEPNLEESEVLVWTNDGELGYIVIEQWDEVQY